MQEVLGSFSQILLQSSIKIHPQGSINPQLRADVFPSRVSFPDAHPLVPFPLAQGFLELQIRPVLVQNHIFAQVHVLKSKRTMPVRFCFPKCPMAERSRGSSDSEEQPKLCSAGGNFPGLHKSPVATGKHPTVFSKFPWPPRIYKNSFAMIPR